MRDRGIQYTLGGMQNSTLKRRSALAVVIAVAGAILAACGGSSAITNVDPAGFQAQAQTAGVTVIDVRTPDEFAAGHIEGAINIDVEGDSFYDGIDALDKTKTYAVYCRTDRRSGIAATEMADAGFTSIYNLDGGIVDWVNAGYELVAG